MFTDCRRVYFKIRELITAFAVIKGKFSKALGFVREALCKAEG